MAFSSYDITTDRGRVRFNLSDTTPSPGAYWFEDEEIDQMLSDEGSVNAATAACLRALLASKGLRMKKFSADGLSYDDTAQLAAIKELLEIYGADLPTLSAVTPAALPMDEGYTEVSIG